MGAGVCAQPRALSSQCWTCQGHYGLKPFHLCMLIQVFHAIPQTGLCIAATLEEFAPALLRELQPNQRPHLEVPWWFRGAGLALKALQLCNQLPRKQRPPRMAGAGYLCRGRWAAQVSVPHLQTALLAGTYPCQHSQG